MDRDRQEERDAGSNYHDVVAIMKHMASFILNFEKSLELSLAEVETLLKERGENRALIEFQKKLHVDRLAKEFVKYNMRVSSFDKFI